MNKVIGAIVFIIYSVVMFGIGPIGWAIWFFTGGPVVLAGITGAEKFKG